jgi:hypothetical protein
MVFQYERKKRKKRTCIWNYYYHPPRPSPSRESAKKDPRAYEMDLTTRFNVSFVAQWEWNDPFSNQGGNDSGIRDVASRRHRLGSWPIEASRTVFMCSRRLSDLRIFHGEDVEFRENKDKEKITLVCGTSNRWVRF